MDDFCVINFMYLIKNPYTNYTRAKQKAEDQWIENKVCLSDNYNNIHIIDNQSFSFLLK